MERYSHLQALTNSPLTPLTPLSENTKFEFNFGGDGSLDVYINDVRHKQIVEQRQKKLLQEANKKYNKKNYALQPRRYSEEFLKIRDVFEGGQNYVNVNPVKVPKVKIIHAEDKRTPKQHNKYMLTDDYEATPTNIRTPLRPLNHNVPQNNRFKDLHRRQDKLKQKCLNILQEVNPQLNLQPKRVFRQASPVATKPLCPHIAKILQHSGLSMYGGIFQREEIDFYAFSLLTYEDFCAIGITNQQHCELLTSYTDDAGRYF